MGDGIGNKSNSEDGCRGGSVFSPDLVSSQFYFQMKRTLNKELQYKTPAEMDRVTVVFKKKGRI